MIARDPWHRLAERTPARIALGRSGVSVPTGEVLALELAHARARDAVHAELDGRALAERLAPHGEAVIEVQSDAVDRRTYLRRPDLGRRVAATHRERLAGCAPSDLVLVVADGLSAPAVVNHAPDVVAALRPLLDGLRLGPIVVARGARVAIGDPIGEALRTRMVAVLIGERPGLTTPDSLGVYLTYGPRPGRSDAERNCVSNIHAGGLDSEQAARRVAWLVRAALQLGLTGIGLKDESGTFGTAPTGLPPSVAPPHSS